jgi:phospholipase C
MSPLGLPEVVPLVAKLTNQGTATLQLALYSDAGVQRFDLAPGASHTAAVAPASLTGGYDVQVHGPNGFLRHASGSTLGSEAGVEATLAVTGSTNSPTLRLTLSNQSKQSQTITVHGLHDNPHRFVLDQHATQVVTLDPLAKNNGWYDLVVSGQGSRMYERRFAGHLENGQPSRTGPD